MVKKTIFFKKLVDDFWGRKRIQNVENKRVYALVGGVWHSTSKDGEPDSPLRADLVFKED
jgi:hypothetical protein